MKTVAACAYSIRARGSFYLTLASTLLLSACQGLPPKAVVDFAEVKPELAAATNATPARASNGSLFHLATYRPAFEDSRARALGDIVTIQIVESLAASQVSKSTVNRNTSSSNSITEPRVRVVVSPAAGSSERTKVVTSWSSSRWPSYSARISRLMRSSPAAP